MDAFSAAHLMLLQLLPILVTFIFFCSLSSTGLVEAADPPPMFVFGDSYLDTGNHAHSDSCWNPPYGCTWPGIPAGRFSDGRVLTDFVAEAVGLSSSPVPYKLCKEEGYRSEVVKYGVNFAVGGSGVFKALNPTNLRVQVDQLTNLLKEQSVQLPSPNQALVLLFTGGNDYFRYFLGKGSVKELPEYTNEIVGEILENLKRLHGLGIRRFAISNLGPIGCIPPLTATVSFKHCIESYNSITENHNRVLTQEVSTTLSALNQTNFFILDQFRAFYLIINMTHLFGFDHNLEPCCHSKTGGIGGCGQVDDSGNSLYEVCPDPNKNLFWDVVHPTQAGWAALAGIMLGNQNFAQNTYKSSF